MRLLAASAGDLADHLRRNGPLPSLEPSRLLSAVAASGLTGRGGAGFPTARKLAAVAVGERPIVVANGAEGEPASAKDKALLAHGPHLVLDGLQLAARAVGAVAAYAYAGSHPAADSLRRAVAQREAAGCDRLPVTVVEAPGTFVAGQESAVVARLEGKPAKPRDTPRLIVEKGVRGHPTLVQNVETLAHLALLARYGPEWFRQEGTRDEPGTLLTTVSGAVRSPGVYEVPLGAPLRDVLDLAGANPAGLQAVLVGGYHGAWLPFTAANELSLSRASLAPWDASPGAGVVVALPLDACGLAESARIVSYLAGQSAGQCGPCVLGLPAMAGAMAGGRPRDAARLAALVERRGACQHPDGTARLARSALRVFAAEIDAHQHGRCTADGRR
jgi:NADH:ubiquinone oxidoreductase subunit F (NADH-binding)